MASEQHRTDMAERRTLWRAKKAGLDPTKLVFLDETWAKTKNDSDARQGSLRRASVNLGPARPLEDDDF